MKSRQKGELSKSDIKSREESFKKGVVNNVKFYIEIILE
jgi:hypothetical protein